MDAVVGAAFYLICALGWVAFLVRAFHGVRSLRLVSSLAAGGPPPRQRSISVVIAAKDNAALLEGTLRHLAAFEYDGLEVIVVNDRSTDESEQVVSTFATQDPRFKLVSIASLPAGWLGKVHALHHGAAAASGDYLLFMDADIRISVPLLNQAVAVCEGLALDHLAVLPRAEANGFWLGMLIATSEILFTMSARPWLPIARRPLKCVKGVGSFNFLRRSFFQNTAGFAWLKMEVADDVALAQLIAHSGGRSLFAKTDPRNPGASFAWYSSVSEMITGLEKNTVGGFTNYRPWRVVTMVGSSIGAVAVPFSALLLLPMPWAVGYLTAFVFSTAIFAAFCRSYLQRPVSILMGLPMGVAFLGVILLRSAVNCFRRGGIRWSGTFYPLEDLRAGVRVRLGL